MNSKEHIEKFKKYEAEFTSYLKAKYFSDKDVNGGVLFESKATVGGVDIKGSRLPGVQYYADPMSIEEKIGSIALSGKETVTSTSSRKHSAKKRAGSKGLSSITDA